MAGWLRFCFVLPHVLWCAVPAPLCCAVPVPAPLCRAVLSLSPHPCAVLCCPCPLCADPVPCPPVPCYAVPCVLSLSPSSRCSRVLCCPCLGPCPCPLCYLKHAHHRAAIHPLHVAVVWSRGGAVLLMHAMCVGGGGLLVADLPTYGVFAGLFYILTDANTVSNIVLYYCIPVF